MALSKEICGVLPVTDSEERLGKLGLENSHGSSLWPKSGMAEAFASSSECVGHRDGTCDQGQAADGSEVAERQLCSPGTGDIPTTSFL